MKKTRSLTLKSESLADLTPGDLNNVVGGAASFAGGGCTLDTIRESYWACSFNCQWTFNTCESCYC